MTEFHVEVVRIGSIEKHPNADTLSLTSIHGGYPVCFKTGEFNEGDLAVYLPVDSVAPSKPEWEFLGEGLRNHRIRAKKLRGIFSMGMLTKAPEGVPEGTDVAEFLGFTRYEEVVAGQTFSGAKTSDGLQVPAPSLISMPGMYDIEGFRKYGQTMFGDDELVVVSEKIHGQNFRAVSVDGVLHVGSRTRWLSTDPDTNTWARVAKRYELAGKLGMAADLVFFGESYGNNADMRYGVEPAKTGDALAIFDIWNSNFGRWLDHYETVDVCKALGLPMAPRLASGPFGSLKGDLLAMAEGPTTIGGAKHVREGWVIKPVVERRDNRIGRIILKLHGEGYLTRKGA